MKKAQGSEKVIDRRIQKTKRLLSEALISLILQKGYEAVTIQDIIDKANIGRSTFYTHYENKDQLLLDGHNNLGVVFFDDNEPLNFLNYFTHVSENTQLAKAMFGKKSGSIFLNHLKSHIAQKIKGAYKSGFAKTKHDKVMLKYISDAAASAIISFTVSWLEDNMPFTNAAIAGKCEQIVESMFAKR